MAGKTAGILQIYYLHNSCCAKDSEDSYYYFCQIGIVQKKQAAAFDMRIKRVISVRRLKYLSKAFMSKPDRRGQQ